MRKCINCNLPDAIYRYPKQKTIYKQFSRSPDRHRQTNLDVIDALTPGFAIHHLSNKMLITDLLPAATRLLLRTPAGFFHPSRRDHNGNL